MNVSKISFGIAIKPQNTNNSIQPSSVALMMPIKKAINSLLDSYISLKNEKNELQIREKILYRSSNIDDLWEILHIKEQMNLCNDLLSFCICELEKVSEELRAGKKFHRII